MKKNRMMRLASSLMVAVLLTTSMISGTFAKYVTEASADDVARVAKWGVEVSASSNAFNTKYGETVNSEGAKLAANVSKVVAPGTNSSEAGGLFQFAISGKPEVATKVTISIKDIQDVFLKQGTYIDWTNATEDKLASGTEYNSTFTLDKDYYPVKWTLTIVDQDPAGTTVYEDKTLKEIETAVNAYIASAEYDPNTELGATFKLEWEWAFDDDNDLKTVTNADRADTLLGNIMADSAKYAKNSAGTALVEATKDSEGNVTLNDYSLLTGFNFTVTVTQVD